MTGIQMLSNREYWLCQRNIRVPKPFRLTGTALILNISLKLTKNGCLLQLKQKFCIHNMFNDLNKHKRLYQTHHSLKENFFEEKHIFQQNIQKHLYILRQDTLLKYKQVILISVPNSKQSYFWQQYLFCYAYIYWIMIRILILVLLFMQINSASPFPDGFDYLSNIDLSIIVSPRYAETGNFVGEIIDGYKKPTVVITTKAGKALSNVQQDLNKQGYSLVVYDAYRPQKAVNHFVRWSKEPENFKTKQEFYPFIDKTDIIPNGYVAQKSGHSRGSTVDLTIIPLNHKLHKVNLIETYLTNGQKILYRDDGSEYMCSHFDFFGESSHHDTNLVSEKCLNQRNLLRTVMKSNGFQELKEQWWHYTLVNEPFPQIYFDFDII